MKPLSIKQTDKETITITWDDNLVSTFSLQQLRDECPCAECKGEQVLMQQILPVLRPKLPGHYELKSIVPVGSYAIQITWGDGHATGLYSWEYLRTLHFTKQQKSGE